MKESQEKQRIECWNEWLKKWMDGIYHGNWSVVTEAMKEERRLHEEKVGLMRERDWDEMWQVVYSGLMFVGGQERKDRAIEWWKAIQDGGTGAMKRSWVRWLEKTQEEQLEDGEVRLQQDMEVWLVMKEYSDWRRDLFKDELKETTGQKDKVGKSKRV